MGCASWDHCEAAGKKIPRNLNWKGDMLVAWTCTMLGQTQLLQSAFCRVKHRAGENAYANSTSRVFDSRFEAAASLTRVLNNGITAPTSPALLVTPSRMEVR